LTNKYRIVKPQPPAVEMSEDLDIIEGTFSGGIVLNESAQDIPLETSPDHDKVRLEKGALRLDYGKINVGAVATSRILGLGEHRFVDPYGTMFEKTFRLTREATFAKIQSLVAGVWTDEVTGDFIIADLLQDWRSYFDKLFFADGTQVYVWDQSALEEDEGNDFPAGNEHVILRDPTDTDWMLEGRPQDGIQGTLEVVVTPAGGEADLYTVHYSLEIRGPTADTGYIEIRVNHGGAFVVAKTHQVPTSTDPARVISLPHQTLQFSRVITPGDVVQLELYDAGGLPATMPGMPMSPTGAGVPGSVPSIAWDKGHTRPTMQGYYQLVFDLLGPAGTADVEFFVEQNGVWELVDTQPFAKSPPASLWTLSHATGFNIAPFADYNAIRKIGLGLTAASAAAGFSFDMAGIPPYVQMKDIFDATLHGFNLAVDADPAPGISYSTTGAAANTIRQVKDEEDNLIIGRYLGIQSDRLLVLRAGGDPQKVQAHANADPSTWHGDGTIETVLASRSDPIDELMAHAMLTSNVGVLFRRRSIMRVISTGQLEPALAFIPWIEKLGTESPFSIAMVPGGLMFLGSDREVYYLTENGPIAVGPPITEGFSLDETNVASVEGLYDPIAQEYTISLPRTAE
jgi:hypothetical protein